VDIQDPPRTRPIYRAPASRKSAINGWNRRDRLPAVPIGRIPDARQEVRRTLADAVGRGLGIHGHFRWSVHLVCPGAELEVYIGHAGHATVEHALRTLPPMIKQALDSLLRSFRGHGLSAAVSGMLSDCITRFDHSITTDFTRMFPGGPAGLQGMSSTQIRRLFQDRMSGPGSQDLTAVTRCLQGSTAIMTLTDPSKHNLWIANLGDSQAGVLLGRHSFVLVSHFPTFIFKVLGSRTHTGDWSAAFVTALHDGNNPSEVSRVQNQHPGEPECMQDNRVVGFLGPTRCEHLIFVASEIPHSKVDAPLACPQLSAIPGSNCHASFLSASFSTFVESGMYSDPRPTSPA
jgi:hypothetical protein